MLAAAAGASRRHRSATGRDQIFSHASVQRTRFLYRCPNSQRMPMRSKRSGTTSSSITCSTILKNMSYKDGMLPVVQCAMQSPRTIRYKSQSYLRTFLRLCNQQHIIMPHSRLLLCSNNIRQIGHAKQRRSTPQHRHRQHRPRALSQPHISIQRCRQLQRIQQQRSPLLCAAM